MSFIEKAMGSVSPRRNVRETASERDMAILNVLFHEQQETDDLTCSISIDDFLPVKTVNGVYYRLSDFGREVFAFVLNSDEDLKREYVELCSFDGYGLGIITSFLGYFHETYAEICMKCDLNGLKYEDIREFFKEFIGNASKENEDVTSMIHEDMDDETIVGMFQTDENMVSEMGEVGTIKEPHFYTVSVRSNEGMTPHFHVYDKQGRVRGRRSKKNKGTHACVQILQNKYFKHGVYTDELDSDIQQALDSFMKSVRKEEEHDEGVGKTNFQYTVSQWNEQNQTKGKPNWINPNTTQKPDYTTITN